MLFAGMLWAARLRARVIALSLSFDFPAFAQKLVAEDGYPELLATSVALEEYAHNLELFATLVAMCRDGPDGGAVVIAAGGNESRRTVSPNFEVGVSAPAKAPHVLSVGALTQDENGIAVAPFSNTRPSLAAPGGGIVSAALGGGLRALNGSSMAAAHAAGCAALWWEHLRQSGSATAAEVSRQMRLNTARDGHLAMRSEVDVGAGVIQTPQP
jgi:subtilisin family serine protease